MSLQNISQWLRSVGAAAAKRKNRRRLQKQGRRILASEQLENRRLMVADLVNFLTQEHVDINIQHTSGVWNVGPRNSDATPEIQYANDEAVMYVGAPAATARPAGANFDFIGVPSGSNFYLLPQSQDTDLLYLGLAAYGVSSSTVDRYVPTSESKGRVSSNARWVKASLSDVRHTLPNGSVGDGSFSAWQTGSFGSPTVYISSFNDGVTNPNGNGLDVTDGISNDDAIWIVAGGHAHFNYGFSKAGRYEIDLKLSAYFGDDGLTTPNTSGYSESVAMTVYFSVVSVGQLEIEKESYSVDEDSGTVSIDVARVGGSDGRVTVDYKTANGSAQSGSDYNSRSGTLEFLDGETRKTIVIPITDDMDEESNESFTLSLSSPKPENMEDYVLGIEGDANGLLGTVTSTVITILDNDQNTAPTISDVVDQSTDEDVPTNAIGFVVNDARTPAAELRVMASSSNTLLIPNSNIVVGGSGSNRTVTITPAANVFGTAIITLVVMDAGGLTASDTFVLTVNSVNDSPTISDIQNQSTELNTATGAIGFTVGDIESAVDDLVVSAKSSNTALVTNANILLGGSGANRTVTITPENDMSGFTTITITVTDINGTFTDETFVLAVGDVNQAPTISNVADQWTRRNLATGEISFSVSDPETAASNLVVTASSSNTALVPNDQIVMGGSGSDRTVTITPAANLSGATTITLTVTDDGGKSSTETFIVLVNDPPTISAIPDQVVVENYSTSPIAFTIGDMETAVADLTISADSSNRTLVPVTSIVFGGSDGNRTVVITPSMDMVGTSIITITITDLNGLQSSESFLLSVEENGLGAVADQFSIYGYDDLIGSVLINDQWHTNLVTPTITLESPVSHGTLTLDQSGAFVYRPSFSFPGNDIFTYRLTNSGGDFTTAEVLITSAALPDFATVLLRGHADIGLALGDHGHGNGGFGEEEEWDLHVHDGESDVEFQADEALLFVGNEAVVIREGAAADPTFDFVGVPVGESFFVLPETENPDLLFLGVGTEEIEVGTLLGGTALLQLVAVNGPGDFSIWNSGSPNPIVRMASADGISPNDLITVDEASHAHFNYAFSKPGQYQVTFIATGSMADGTEIHGENVTFFFRVGNSQPVATADFYEVTVGSVLKGNVALNDGDADGDDTIIRMQSNVTKGTLSLDSDGSFVYIPSSMFDGTDSFSYMIVDAFEGSSVTTVTISSTVARSFDAYLLRGHVDIGLALGGHDGHEDEWDLHVHDEENESEYHPDEAQLFVGNQALVVREGSAADPMFDFLGVAVGESVYVLEQTENPNLIFLGIGAEEIESGSLLGGIARLQLVSVNGPGEFSVWKSGATQPDLHMATSDGIDLGDFVTILEGSHAHYNFAFSKAGEYEITFQAIGALADGTEVLGENTKYFFRVGNNDPVSVDDHFLVGVKNAVHGNVMLNDYDLNADPLSVQVLSNVSKGTLALRGDGSFVYTPSILFDGTDSFTYVLSDKFEGSSTAMVTISAAVKHDFEVHLLRGHADIGLALVDSTDAEVQWDMHVHDEENDVEYHADEAELFVGNDAQVIREGNAAASAFDFLGVPVGETFYVLPETENTDLLFLGFGGEEIPGGTLLGGLARLQLISVNGPGQFSIWNSQTTQPTLRMATTDGIDRRDFIEVIEGGHSHYNLGFSKRGSYEITLQPIGRMVDGTEVVGEYTTFFFRVGNDAPQAVNDSLAVQPGNVLQGNVLLNDFDPNNDRLTSQVLAAPSKGTLMLRADGSFVYTPSQLFDGADSFSYTVSDPYEGTFVGNVMITEAVGRSFEAHLVTGHVDIGLALGDHEGGDGHGDHEWDLHVHDEESDTEYHPDEAQLVLNAVSRTIRTGPAADPAFDFIGVAPGSAFYMLPQIENVNQIFLGIAAEEVAAGTFFNGTAKLQLISVNGPGEFSIWNNDLGGPIVRMASFDGINESDFVTILEGSHSHFNYAFSQLGTYEITVQATATLAEGEVVTSGYVTYFFRVANLEPTLTAISEMRIDEDAGIQTVEMTDIGSGSGEDQNVRIVVSSNNTALVPTPVVNYSPGSDVGRLQFTPTANLSGTATITVTMEDAGFDGDFNTTADNALLVHTIAVTINAVNDQPTLAPISNRNLQEDASTKTVSYAGISAGGGESQPLRVIATSSNTGLIPNPSVNYSSPLASGTLTFTPVANQSGTAVITVTAEDGGLDNDLSTVGDNGSVSQTFVVSVNAVNDTPTLDPVVDVTINEDAAEQVVNLTGITAGGGESQPLLVVVTSSNTGLIPDPVLDYTSPNSAATLRFTPVANMFGTSVITVTVTDGGLDSNLSTTNGNLTFTRTFVVNVISVNDRPIAGNDSYQIFINGVSDFDVRQNDSDVEDSRNSLLLEVVTQPQGGIVTVNDGQLRFVPNRTRLGSDSFTYRVIDTAGLASEVATVNLLLQEFPQTNPDTYWTAKNQRFIANVLANDISLVSPLVANSLALSNVTPAGSATIQNGQVRITPPTGYIGTVSFSYTVSNQLNIVSAVTSVTVNVLDRSFQNPQRRFDVNGDFYVTAMDALIIINELNRRGPRALNVLTDFAPPYYDVNGDFNLNASDALAVINHLNSLQFGGTGGASGEGEGELWQDDGVDNSLSSINGAAGQPGNDWDSLQDHVDAALIEMLAEDHQRRQRAWVKR